MAVSMHCISALTERAQPNVSYLTAAAVHTPRNLYELQALLDLAPHETEDRISPGDLEPEVEGLKILGPLDRITRMW
jgi:hypothetical protein